MPAPADPATVARALELCRRGRSPEEAQEELARGGVQVSYRTIYRALKKAEEAGGGTALVPAGAPPVEVEVEAIAVPADVAAAAVGTADAAKARAIRRMVGAQKYSAATVERLAATWHCDPRDVRALVIEAAILAGEHVLPPELAREESIEVARKVRDKALDSADWKSVLLAQQHIDRVQLPPPPKPGTVPDGMTQAEVAGLLRRILLAVRSFPGAVEAVRGVLEGS